MFCTVKHFSADRDLSCLLIGWLFFKQSSCDYNVKYTIRPSGDNIYTFFIHYVLYVALFIQFIKSVWGHWGGEHRGDER